MCLLGETKFWKQYVRKKFNENIQQESWKAKISDFVETWCYFWELDDMAPILNSTIVRTYGITKRNEEAQENIFKNLMQRSNIHSKGRK